MASIKISGLTEQTTASDTDLLPVASSAGSAKRMTLANFVTWLASKLNSKFAPAGFGLGEMFGKWCGDANNATTIGFYWFSGESAVNVPNGFKYGVLLVERRDTCIYQTAKSANGFVECQIAIRYSRDDGATWSEWEHINPPMELGIEYRTTERWQGKPVYVKAINFGYLPNNARSATSHGITSKHTNLRYTIMSVGTNRLLTGNSYIPDIFADDTEISILTTADLSAMDVVFTLWYTKY